MFSGCLELVRRNFRFPIFQKQTLRMENARHSKAPRFQKLYESSSIELSDFLNLLWGQSDVWIVRYDILVA